MSDVDTQVRGILQREFLSDRPDVVISAEENLVDSEIIDSLGIMMLVGFIEKDFGIEIDPEEIVADNFVTIAAIDKLVRTKLTG